MTDEQFEKEVDDIAENLRNLHRLRDAGLKKWLKAEIRFQLIQLLKNE